MYCRGCDRSLMPCTDQLHSAGHADMFAAKSHVRESWTWSKERLWASIACCKLLTGSDQQH